MLKQLRKQKPEKPGVEELFLAHYERVFDWALHLTDHDRERAEDLVHDVFIQLSLNPPKIERIENWENYLFIVLRNLHRYQWRRERRGVNGNALSITDYDSIETGLQTIVNFDNRLQIWEELQIACRYAVERRETSRAGSVFILRFFHGFYPSEIARILCGTRPAVTELLRVARAEVRAVLQNPSQLSFLKKTDAAPIRKITLAEDTPEGIIKTLREQIFARRAGKCLSDEALSNLFEANHASLIDREKLAHFVVCENCLRRINRLLEMPDLSDRFPPDMLGPDSANGSNQPAKNVKSFPPARNKNNQKRQSLERFRRKLQAVYEHEPHELWVAVNDSILGTQPIVAAATEQTLGLETFEDVRFVHVFSEQNVPLCALPIESPPAGDFEQHTRINLSDDRTLEVNLSFCGNWRHIRVVYSDSSLETIGAAESISSAKLPNNAEDTEKFGVPPLGGIIHQPAIPHKSATPNAHLKIILENQTEEAGEQTADSPRRKFGRLFDWLAPFFKREFWLRPMTIAVLLTLPLVALLVFWKLSETGHQSLTAKQLLEKAAIAETNAAPNLETSVRRVLEVEERRADNRIVARYRVEVWRKAAAPNSNEYTMTRRVFDENEIQIAGEWLKTDGMRIRKNLIGKKAKYSTERQAAAPASEIAETVWLEPSVNNLRDLIGDDFEQIKVVENENSFTLEAAAPNSQSTVKKISLTVGKTDYRATRQSLWIERADGELREFRFVETKFQKLSPAEIPADVFNPDSIRPDLPASVIKPIEQIVHAPPNVETTNESNADSAAPIADGTANNRVATAEMEVEALNLLNAAKADLSEQISVVRIPNGVLQIKGIVETAERKAELLRALAPLAANPAIEIKIQTVAEAVAEREKQNRKNGKSSTANETIIEQKDADSERLAADDDLRRFFNARGTPSENLDREIERFAQNAFAASRRVAQHAGALRRTVSRFTAAEVEKLSPEARAAYLALIKKHARNLQSETNALRRTIAPVFGESSATSGAGETIAANDVAAVQQTAARLVALANESDRNIRAAFSASPNANPAAALKSKNFWNNLQRIEQTAAALSKN